MQIITKNIRWRAIINIYKTAMFDHCAIILSSDIVLTERCAPPQKKKNNNKIKNGSVTILGGTV